MSMVSGIVGAKMQSDSSDKAAKAAKEAAYTASQTELQISREAAELTAPWRKAGEEALNLLSPKIQAGPGEFVPEEDPGYKFGYKEFVEKPLLRGASAQGRLGGGRNLKELSRYATDYASTKYDNFLNRWYESLNPLQSLAGVGQTTATQQGQNLLNTGSSIAQNELAAGDARASGYINQGNIWGTLAKDQGQNALNAYMMYGGMGG